MDVVVCTTDVVCTAYLILNQVFESSFHNSKRKARSCLFTETKARQQKRRTSFHFQLWNELSKK